MSSNKHTKVCILTSVHSLFDIRIFHKEAKSLIKAGYNVGLIVQLICSVADTGIGISPDDQLLIFDEFFQVDSAPDSQRRGAGLGLTLANKLAESLGGNLSLSSEIARGSRFTLALPVKTL